MMGIFGGLWTKLLILAGIMMSVMFVIFRIESKASKIGKFEEQAQQRSRNAKIRKLQQAEDQNRPSSTTIDDLLDQL